MDIFRMTLVRYLILFQRQQQRQKNSDHFVSEVLNLRSIVTVI